MKDNFYHVIHEYEQFKQLHILLKLRVSYIIKTQLLGAAIKEAHDRINNGRCSDIDELVELRNVVPEGEKRYRDLMEIKKMVEKDIQELKYLLN